MRVLVTGMGGYLGTDVALALEQDDRVDAITGVDSDPPRRHLHRATFHRVDPRDRLRTAEVVRTFEPTALVHLGVYEPYARASPKAAVARTANGTIGVLDAAVEAGTLDRIVVRSGVEVYGRGRGSPLCPDEQAAVAPTCEFGHLLAHTERLTTEAARAAGAPVTRLRFAQLAGPHLASPLGRYLRLHAVPFHLLGDPPFSVLDREDATAAVIAALHAPFDGPVNVVSPGEVTASQAARTGNRLPVPVLPGPGWQAARLYAELLGAPVPDHVHELLTRGRVAKGASAFERIGVRPAQRTVDVIERLYEWAEVEYLRVSSNADMVGDRWEAPGTG